MNERERINIPRRNLRALPLATPQTPDPVNTRQFDESRVYTFDYVPNGVGSQAGQRFGPFEVYTAPDQIGRAEILWCALVGIPTFLFQNRASFQLNIFGGGTQDFLPKARDANDPANPLGSGIRFTRYGCLDDPFPVKILLKSQARLDASIVVNAPELFVSNISAFAFPFTIYTRVAGLIFVRQDA